MKTRLALVAAFLAASTGFAAAQTPPPPPPPGAEAPPESGDAPPPPRRGEDAGPGERGPHGERGPGWRHGMGKGPGPDGASFNLRMGGTRLNVDCGAEALGACIEASRPLIDLVGGGAGSSAMPKPPGSSLTLPPTPPAPGDIPPATPGMETPGMDTPVAPAN